MKAPLLTNHARVLISLVELPGCTLRELAETVGLTERATHRIVDDLVQSTYVTRHKLGNRSFYEVHADRPLNENGGATVGDLLRPLIAERT
jgi:uncharacterized membrane protein